MILFLIGVLCGITVMLWYSHLTKLKLYKISHNLKFRKGGVGLQNIDYQACVDSNKDFFHKLVKSDSKPK